MKYGPRRQTKTRQLHCVLMFYELALADECITEHHTLMVAET
jgi:hypothetical protein